MRRPAWTLATALLVACASTGPTAPERPLLPGAAALAEFAWLAGTHRAVVGDQIVEEVWTHPGGSTMFGVSRTIVGAGLVGFEFLRIEARPDAIVYIAHPSGRTPGTEFAWVPPPPGAPHDDAFVFENLAHDFPTRIVYRRVDATHTQARAENDEQALVLDFERVR